MEDKNQKTPLRDDLVNTAVKFLQNPKVSPSPLKQKQEFLRRKGLTDREIHRACELSGASSLDHEFVSITMPQQKKMYIEHQHPQSLLQSSMYLKIKEFFNAAAIIAATVYGIYWFYKKFIEGFLFGNTRKKDKKDPVEKLNENMKKSINGVEESINKVKNDVQQLSQNQMMVPALVNELKQDLTSLKSLLLSRKQFPSAPASIPSWQLEASSQGREKTTDREDDAGSGSSTNNSDSSLEMIREDPSKE